jgi:hypothetical protein
MMAGSAKWGEGICSAAGGCASAAVGQRADSTNPLTDEKFVGNEVDMSGDKTRSNYFVGFVGRFVAVRFTGNAVSRSSSTLADAGRTVFVAVPFTLAGRIGPLSSSAGASFGIDRVLSGFAASLRVTLEGLMPPVEVPTK